MIFNRCAVNKIMASIREVFDLVENLNDAGSVFLKRFKRFHFAADVT